MMRPHEDALLVRARARARSLHAEIDVKLFVCSEHRDDFHMVHVRIELPGDPTNDPSRDEIQSH